MGTTWSLRSSPPLGTQLWYDNAIWVDPTNNDFLVVGGVDAFRSTNGGASFTRITDWTQYHLGFSAHADQHAFVPAANYNGTTVRTVYFANDGGIQPLDPAEIVVDGSHVGTGPVADLLTRGPGISLGGKDPSGHLQEPLARTGPGPLDGAAFSRSLWTGACHLLYHRAVPSRSQLEIQI